MLGARTGAWTKSGYTAKDYVQDGLVAMWDGIENAGWGVHDPNATVWKDLIGSKNMTLANGATFDTNSMKAGEKSICYASYEGVLFGSTATLELIFSGIDNDIYETIFTRSDDYFSIYNNSAYNNEAAWTVKGPNERPKLSTAHYKPLVVSWDSSGSKIQYQDGSEVGSSTSLYNGGGTAEWSICGRDSIHKFIGNVYCVRIYDRVLTADEIAANYAIDKARFDLPDQL